MSRFKLKTRLKSPIHLRFFISLPEIDVNLSQIGWIELMRPFKILKKVGEPTFLPVAARKTIPVMNKRRFRKA